MATTFFGINLRHVRQGITDGLNYWGCAMRSILPKSIQRRLTVGDEQLIVRLDGDNMLVEQNVNGALQTLATYPQVGDLVDGEALKLVKKKLSQDSDFILQVADDVVLSKMLGFPVAVADNLRQTVLYEMDKHTPFAKEDVLFDVAIENRQATTLQARLYLLHRNQVAPVLGAFQQAKLRFDRICPQHDMGVNLLPEGLRRSRLMLPGKRNILLGVLWLTVLTVAFLLPLYFKRDTAMKLEAQIATLSEQALGEGELWETRDEEERNILAFIESYPMPFSHMYEELSKRLPDDAWVSDLTYQSGHITIRGEGKDAAGLIARINASPLFKNARIMSPIVKSQLTVGKEVFNIAFDVVTVAKEGGQGA